LIADTSAYYLVYSVSLCSDRTADISAIYCLYDSFKERLHKASYFGCKVLPESFFCKAKRPERSRGGTKQVVYLWKKSTDKQLGLWK